MLKITIPASEQWDEIKGIFIYPNKEQTLQLEHSLVSLSKWESKWRKPFLTKGDKTIQESIDYVRCMTITPNVDSDVYNFLTKNNIDEVATYIEAPMTATTFSNNKTSINREIITSEIIYYWMVALSIPFECEKWHLNRLLTLINVCNIKNQPAKKMSARELYNRNKTLNAARKAELNTTG
jgi:hypothetical protein